MSDVRIRYLIDLVDRGTQRLLAQDRKVQQSTLTTQRLAKKVAASATTGATAQARASTKVAAGQSATAKATASATAAATAQAQVASKVVAGQSATAKATASATAATQALSAAQQRALTVGAQIITVNETEAKALRAQAAAARSAAAAQTELAASSKRAAASARSSAAATASAGSTAKRARSSAAATASAGSTAKRRPAAAANRPQRRRHRAGRAGSGAIAAAGVAGRATRSLAGAAGLGTALGLGVAAKQTIEFDKAMRNVNSIAGLTEKQFQATGKSIRALAGDTAQAPKTLAEGMYDLVSSGFNAKQSLSILGKSARAASAGLTTTEVSTAAVAAVLNAYRLPASRAGVVSDQLFKTVDRGVVSFEQLAANVGDVLPFASSLGVGLDQVGASISTMTKAGIAAPETMTRIKAVMTSLLKPNDDLAAAVKKTGASSAEALLKEKGFQGGLEALVGTTDGSKSAIASLFPNVRALGGALALTGENAKGAREDLAGLKDASGATAKALAEQSKSVAFRWNKLKAEASALGITVGSKLVPALGDAVSGLSALAAGRGKVGGFAKNLVAGISGAPPQREKPTRLAQLAARAAGTTATTGAPLDPGKTQQAGTKIRAVIDSIITKAKQLGPAVLSAGRQLVDAFKPAMPFLTNIVLPVLEGVAKGVAGSVVVAFRILVPVIRVAANVLGLIGKAAAPLKPVFRGIGTVIGFLAGGPILKLLGTIPKVGGVFRALAIPIRLVGNLFTGIPRAISRAAGKALSAARSVAGRILEGISTVAWAPGRVAGFIGQIPGRIAGQAEKLASGAGKLGKAIVSGIVNAIRSAPRAIIKAITSLIPGPIRKIASKIPVLGSLFKRRGGRIRAFNDGGLVPILAAGGEMLVDRGRATMIGGRPDRDATPMLARPGAAVLTGSGQQMMAGGASLQQAIAGQMPHFARGGRVQRLLSGGRVASLARAAGFSGQNLITSLAVAKGESGWRENASNRNRDGSIDKGLWQINSVHGALSSFDPARNAKAAYKISGAGKNFRPWVVYQRGLYRQHLAAARRAAGSSAGSTSSGSGSAKVAINLGASSSRAGLVSDALSQGVAAGQAGLTRREFSLAAAGARGRQTNPILAAISAAQTETSRDVTATGRAGGAGGKLGRSAGTLKSAMSAARKSGLQITSTTGGKHAPNSWHYKRRAFDAGGSAGAMRGYATATAKRWGSRLLELFHDPLGWFIKNGRRVKGAIGGHRGHVHTAMRRGGMVGGLRRMRAGGYAGAGPTLSRAVSSALTFKGGSLQALDDAIGQAATTRIEALRRGLVRAVRAGGSKKTVQRLQSAIDLAEFEVGRRIGAILDRVSRRTSQIDRGRSAIDRAVRLVGVDPGSPQGLAAQAAGGGREIALRRANAAALNDALARAKRTGDREQTRAISDQLAQAKDDLAEAIVSQVERWRDIIRATAQQRVDSSQFALDVGQAALGGFDVIQRLTRTAESAAGKRQRAQAIQTAVIPALGAQRNELYGQAAALKSIGDIAGARQAFLGAAQASIDLGNAMADASDLIRDAALQVVQEAVDSAASRKTFADLGFTTLELQQKLDRTYDSAGGGQARADYIRSTVLPALQGELVALRAQQAEAAAQGDPILARQIGEAIAGEQNAILQAQLDAQEQTASNTDSLKEFSGSTAFSYRDQLFTDLDVIRATAGA